LVTIQGISGGLVYYSMYISLSWLLYKVYQAVLVIIQGDIRFSWLLFKVYHAAVVNIQGITSRRLVYYLRYNVTFGYYSRFTLI
jgi:hypothetical protein